MNARQPLPATPEEDDAYYRAVLLDLIDRGADLARRIHENATLAEATPENSLNIGSIVDPTAAFDRITRAVRRTIALARNIAKGPAARQERTGARQKLIRGVEDAIHRKRRESDAESLHAELRERLEDPELEFDLHGRPTQEIIEEICRDLGIAVQPGGTDMWKRRTPQDISALRARAAQPHAPRPPPAGAGAVANDPAPILRTRQHNGPS